MTYLILAVIFAIIVGTLCLLHLLGIFLRALTVRPHQCKKSSTWMPVVASVGEKICDFGTVRIAFMKPGGGVEYEEQPIEYGQVRFKGVQCSCCGARLVCKSCHGTPKSGGIIKSRSFVSRTLQCCQTPVFGDR